MMTGYTNLRTCIESMLRRIAALIKDKGGSTDIRNFKYIISTSNISTSIIIVSFFQQLCSFLNATHLKRRKIQFLMWL